MKKHGFLYKFLISVVILIILFVVTVFGTKYYFYDSDYAVKKTDLLAVSIDGIKLGMNINDIDLSKYTNIDSFVEGCNHNFKEISIKSDSKGKIKYIVASYKDVEFDVGQESSVKLKKVNEIWDILGKNYKTDMYNSQENNYWKISKYSDTDNHIYLGIVFSRYNNDILNVILSDERIKD